VRPAQAEGFEVKQAQNDNIEVVGFGASNPAHTAGGQMRRTDVRTSDWFRRPGGVVRRVGYLLFDQETIARSIVNEASHRPPGEGRPSGIAP